MEVITVSWTYEVTQMRTFIYFFYIFWLINEKNSIDESNKSLMREEISKTNWPVNLL